MKAGDTVKLKSGHKTITLAMAFFGVMENTTYILEEVRSNNIQNEVAIKIKIDGMPMVFFAHYFELVPQKSVGFVIE